MSARAADPTSPTSASGAGIRGTRTPRLPSGYSAEMRIGLEIELHVTCPKCVTVLPTNGVCDAVACHCCGNTTELGDEFWSERFDGDDFEPLLLAAGKSETSSVGGVGGIRSHLRYTQQLPLCVGCRKPLDLETAADGAIACACGKSNRVRAADEHAKRIDRRAQLLIGETSTPIVRVTKPVVFACMKCGGSLAVDGTVRTLPCSYCAAPNYLPDGVWQVIYPVPTLEVFYVVCEYDEAALREARWTSMEVRVRDAARTDLTQELYSQLAHDDEDDVRAALATNPAVDPGLLARLTTDDEEDVRAAVVGNVATPVDALATLARTESSTRVLGVLVTRSDLPAAVVEALAGSKETVARVHALAHPSLSVTTLRTLAGDAEDRVKKVAKAKIAELEARGVKVPGGGLFSRLFGG